MLVQWSPTPSPMIDRNRNALHRAVPHLASSSTTLSPPSGQKGSRVYVIWRKGKKKQTCMYIKPPALFFLHDFSTQQQQRWRNHQQPPPTPPQPNSHHQNIPSKALKEKKRSIYFVSSAILSRKGSSSNLGSFGSEITVCCVIQSQSHAFFFFWLAPMAFCF